MYVAVVAAVSSGFVAVCGKRLAAVHAGPVIKGGLLRIHRMDSPPGSPAGVRAEFPFSSCCRLPDSLAAVRAGVAWLYLFCCVYRRLPLTAIATLTEAWTVVGVKLVVEIIVGVMSEQRTAVMLITLLRFYWHR